MENNFKILDCTLRDGGYVNNWDFDWNWVENYLNKISKIEKIGFVEIGYKNPEDSTKGEFYQVPLAAIKKIKLLTSKKLAIMIDGKRYQPDTALDSLKGLAQNIDLVRIAINQCQLDLAVVISSLLKENGFNTAICLMKIAEFDETANINFDKINQKCDLFYLMDSHGRIETEALEKLLKKFQKQLILPLGFHPHNDKALAFDNAKLAISQGCSYIDATSDGIGRGAGNLNIEKFIAYCRTKSHS